MSCSELFNEINMSKKIKSYYFKHDCYAHEDDKLVELRMKQGAAGYGIYFLLLELLSTATDGMLERNYKRIAYILREDEALIKDVIEAYDLFELTEDAFWSPRLKAHIDKLLEYSERQSEAGKAGAQKRWGKGSEPIANPIDDNGKPYGNPNGQPMATPMANNNIIIDNKRIDKNKEDNNKKDKNNKKATSFNVEAILRDEPDEIKEAINRWLEYKKSQYGFRYKSADSFKTFLKKLNELSGNNVTTALKIIEQSIANGWAGIFELKNKGNGTNQLTNQDIERAVECGIAMSNAGTI